LLYDASFDYEIGDFDGSKFITDKKVGKGDFGNHYYAAQTFYNSPDKRTVIIGWMPTRDKNIFIDNKTPWNQQMSFPSTMELRTSSDGIKLYRNPIKEIENLYIKSYLFSNKKIKNITKRLNKIDFELIDLTLSFKPEKNDEIIINLRGKEIKYKNEFFTFQNTKIPAPKVNDYVKIRVLVDRPSIELFINDGESVMTTYSVSNKNNRKILFKSNRNLNIELEINKLKSSWK